jgi:hypothetical protein
VRVTTAAGKTELSTPDDRRWLSAGESATLVEGQIVATPVPTDPLLTTGWMHALLVRKDPADAELAERVDSLLKRMEQAESPGRYEQEIRSLGDYAARPLRKFVQSHNSQVEAQRRRVAMRILADVAPSAMIPDLIALLDDDDAEIRVLAAAALHRLTGLDQERPLDVWRAPTPERQPTRERWRQWWSEQDARYQQRDAA